MDGYRTVLAESSDSFMEKRSRFIGYAKPVSSVQEAVDFINEIKSKHWDATHNVYAYVIREGQLRRYSDDGEPQGTAGMPVLDVLLKEGLSDVCVVVTRYFGGILLGAGGLVRAYSHGAKIAVEAAVPVNMSPCTVFGVSCDYNFYGKLNSLITDNGGIIESTDFSGNVDISFFMPKEKTASFLKKVTDASAGKCSCVEMGEKYGIIRD